MTDRKETRPDVEEIEAVDEWIRSSGNYDSEGTVTIEEPDEELFVGVFSHLGADFEPEPEMVASLSEYSNLRRRPGMDAVWGQEFMDQYNAWTQEWVTEYEASTGKKLPRLKGESLSPEKRNTTKISGPRQWFGELTAYLVGTIDFKTYKGYTETRLRNGWLFAESQEKGKEYLREKRVRIQTSISLEPMRVSSIPPGFVEEAWEWIKTQRQVS